MVQWLRICLLMQGTWVPSLVGELRFRVCVCVCASVGSAAQSCPTLCDPTDCSSPGSSVHGILQARILEWVAIPFSRGSSQPRDQTQASCIAGRFFIVWVQYRSHTPQGNSAQVPELMNPHTATREKPEPQWRAHLPQWRSSRARKQNSETDSGEGYRAQWRYLITLNGTC